MDSIFFKTPLGIFNSKIVSDDSISIISFRTKRKLHWLEVLQGMCDGGLFEGKRNSFFSIKGTEFQQKYKALLDIPYEN
jgi:hypothetical protein